MSKNNTGWKEKFDFKEKKSDNKDLFRFIGRILDNWYWFVLGVLLGLTLAFTYLREALPTYKVHAKLLVSDDIKMDDLSGLIGSKHSVNNEVEVLRSADLMREMIITEKAYIDYYRKGAVRNTPILNTAFSVELLSNPDSVERAYSFEVKPIAGHKIELSNPDTLFQVQWSEAFHLPLAGQLRIHPLSAGAAAKNQGFRISPLQYIVEDIRESLTVEQTNKNVSTIDLTIEHALPKRGEQLLSSLINKYLALNAHYKNEVIDSTLAFIHARISTITKELAGVELAQLQQMKQAQYLFLQEKREEAAIRRTANISNARVIDSAKAERYPSSPNRKMLYTLSIILGLCLPLGILRLRDLFNIRIRSVEDLESRNKLPILAMISHSEEKQQVVVSKSSQTTIAEQFRAMRTNLEFTLNGGKRILFTSSMSGEGKSYIALNLAVSLALLDKKVLLMELDLRKPSVTAKIGLPTDLGFSHYIAKEEMQMDEIIIPSGIHENVDLIQAGAIPPNPAELLIHPRAAELMHKVEQRYDYILMDAPPVGMVTDAQLLSRYSDCCLYIIRQEHTYKEQLRIPNDLQASNKINPIMLVVNDVKAKSGYYRNYGYRYGYGHGYEHYSKEGKKKKWNFFNL